MEAYLSPAATRPNTATAWMTVSVWVLVACGALGWLVFSYGYIEDDAFIHLEFARSLAEGHGFSFNGQLVNGDTAPLWVVLLVAIHSLGFGWIVAAKILCGAGVLIALSGAWRVAAGVAADGNPAHRYLPLAAVLLTATNPYFVHWSFSGMESVTALGISLWAIWSIFSPSPKTLRRLAAGAVLLAIAPLLRPELLLLSAAAGLALLYQAWRLPATYAGRCLTVVLFAMIMVLPTLLWSAYAYESFGSMMPNTNAAKRGGDLVSVAAKLASVYLIGFAATLIVFPFVARRLWRPGVPAMIWILLLWPMACVVFYLADHSAVQTRYCLLSMPSVTIAVLWLLAESVRPMWMRNVVVAMAIVGSGVVIAIVCPHVANKVRLVNTLSTVAAFIREKVPPNAPIAVYAIGQLAFDARHPLIDIGGITRPGVLAYLGDQAGVVRWARGQGAQFYIGGESPQPGSESIFSYQMPFLGWTLKHSSYDTSGESHIYRLP